MTSKEEELLSRLPPGRRQMNGMPDPRQASARARAAALVEANLADLLEPNGIHTSPLGPEWSGDLDVFVRAQPDPARLEEMGWLCLDPLLRRLGSDPGEGRWAVIEDGRVLACADLTVGHPPDPVQAVLARCRRRGMVRAREVLELRALLQDGYALPEDPVVRLAARAEAALGGDLLASRVDGPPIVPPAELPLAWLRRLWRLRPSLRPRLVVGISGVDGSGKSTLCRRVARDLDQAGVPVDVVWSRPGMGVGLGGLEWLARLAKRLMRHDPSPGVRRVAGGERLPWRRGPMGWVWALLVTLAFLADVRLQYARAIGVVICDRHLPDALVTLDFVYGGTDLRLQRALIGQLIPPASLAVYVSVPPDTALARAKSEETFRGLAVRRQLQEYDKRLMEMPGIKILDGTRPAGELSAQVFRWIVAPDR
jgi:thymidylate kinase